MQTIKIEMIHDIVCSWCAIGYRHLQTALHDLEGQVEADLHFLPFELNPDMSPEGEDIVAHLGRRYGWDEERVMTYRRDLIPKGLAAGVHFDFSKRTHYYNTFDAHCLMHWAEQQGRQVELNEVLIPAYHSEGANLADRQALLDLAARAGLDREAARQALVSGELVQPAKQKMARVATYKVRSVPAFIFNETDFVSGSNSPEFFLQYLHGQLKASTTAA